MRQRVLFLLLFPLSGWLASAAVAPIYVNDGPVQSPPETAPMIDALAFVNESTFEVNGYSTYGYYPLPFQTYHTLCFTNRGLMSGDPGFRFDNYDGVTRRWMSWWVNEGDIYSFNTNLLGIVLGISQGNMLIVNSTNIRNSGYLAGDDQSVLQLNGNNIDLTRSRIRTGLLADQSYYYGALYLLSTNYYNDGGISDVWWGVGRDNVLGGQGTLLPLNGGPNQIPNFTTPYPISPSHEVLDAYGFTNLVNVPTFYTFLPGMSNNFFFANGFTAAAYTNYINATSRVVQVVFYPTNTDPNLTTEVRFYPGGSGAGQGAMVAVGFHVEDNDPVLQLTYTNSLYLVDAMAFRSNLVLAANSRYNTRKPNTYALTRRMPYQYYFGYRANSPYDPSLLYRPGFVSNEVSTTYAGYAARVFGLNYTPSLVPTLADPTNFPGRVEIWGNQVNLNQTFVRAESTFMLKAANLVNNKFATINSPYVYFDVATTQPSLLISNVAPADVHRLSGYVFCWSAMWQNSETNATSTNNIQFHALIVDHMLSTVQPVSFMKFKAKTVNGAVQIADKLNINSDFQIVSKGLHVRGALNFPPRCSWGNTNLVNVLNFTNDGIVVVPGVANIGTDRPAPYSSFINRGTNIALSYNINATYFENTDWLSANGGGLKLVAGGIRLRGKPVSIVASVQTNWYWDLGMVLVTNVSTNLVTNSFNAALVANSSLSLYGSWMTMTNAFLQAGGTLQGTLTVSITNKLTDCGWRGINTWVASGGIKVLRLPPLADLRNTMVISRPRINQSVDHIWPAADYGPTARGYTNNLALAKLTLDGASRSFYTFAGASARCALYVDYLEFAGYAETNFQSVLSIAPSLTIYFANANVAPAKLEKAYPGRLVWVKDHIGPLSATNMVYWSASQPPTSNTYRFNIALVQSKDRDDDGDGILNAYDSTPIYMPETVAFNITNTKKTAPNGAQQVLLSWQALGNSVSYLEAKSSTAPAANWQVLQRVTNVNSLSTKQWAYDALTGYKKRFYRVRVVPNP